MNEDRTEPDAEDRITRERRQLGELRERVQLVRAACEGADSDFQPFAQMILDAMRSISEAVPLPDTQPQGLGAVVQELLARGERIENDDIGPLMEYARSGNTFSPDQSTRLTAFRARSNTYREAAALLQESVPEQSRAPETQEEVENMTAIAVLTDAQIEEIRKGGCVTVEVGGVKVNLVYD